MGREVKRVPLDFDWPIEKIWPGYNIKSCIVSDDCDECEKFRKTANIEADCLGYVLVIPVPEGEGYQMWENTTEGSPISPVFDTPEKLARWLYDSNASSFGDCTASYEQWLNMIKGPGFAPSMVMTRNALKSGVAHVGDEK